MRRLALWLLPLWVLLACEFSFSSATITSATLAKGYADGAPINPTTTFLPSDHVFHLVVNVANAPDATKVSAAWSIVAAGDLKEHALDQNEIALKGGENIAHFTLSNSQDWLRGKYKVEIGLNGKPERTLEFEVQ